LDDHDHDQAPDDARYEANAAIGTGLGIGAFGAASAVLLGATCPMCVIASPALIGYGLYKRAKLSRAEAAAKRNDCGSPDDQPPAAVAKMSRSAS
jgi:hypothetical protein